ncbi:DUF6473 family protein [Tropicibacter sp. Alg240-R139]|uniref:DUF6473 family protein n=1 Tax=Tropicibacter sp. Alg240-R139 TaxID=2305991 RepID=UPI0013DF3CC7|nr:DUF6473 family protein [Tropicibacter sp. Alg240-R139]
MSYEVQGVHTPDHLTCRYGVSKLHFRGPKRSLEAPYVACIGGTETYGRFVPDPFPALLERQLSGACVNFGSINSGLDSVLNDPELMRLAHKAEACIVQLPGAQNLSNRLYRVHPRRNDRFLEASNLLKALYDEVDYTEFNFNKHLLGRLLEISQGRFEIVCEELRQAWMARMRSLVEAIDGQVLLLWLRYAPSEDGEAPLGTEPLMVTPDMVDSLRGAVASVIELPVKMAGDSEELGDMIFGTMQEPAAEHMIGPATHQIIADRVYRALRDLD